MMWRGDFPIFERRINGKPLVYLDSASSTQKPHTILDAMQNFYRQSYANIHRGVYQLSAEATESYEAAHRSMARFLNAKFEECIFTSGATHGINLLSYTLQSRIKPDDEIVLTQLEHHSNLVPWQQLARRAQAKLRFVPLLPDGNLDIAAAESLINEKTAIVAATHISNSLGTIVPVQKLAKLAHAHRALVVIDAAQSVPHMPVDVQSLDADFLVFSGHKMYGPTGTGGLYGRRALLDSLPPFFTGGDMIREVQWESATWNDLPWKFEAGTPNIAGMIGLGQAVHYLEKIGMDNIQRHEEKLTAHTMEKLSREELEIYGPHERGPIIAFNIPGVHAHDVAAILDSEAICIRGGHHCTMPLHHHLNITASARVSFGLYNTEDDVDRLCAGLSKAKKIFKVR